MDFKSLERLELDKILSAVSNFSVLDDGRRKIRQSTPSTDLNEVRFRLAATGECDKLLYRYGVSKIEYFSAVTEISVLAYL